MPLFQDTAPGPDSGGARASLQIPHSPHRSTFRRFARFTPACIREIRTCGSDGSGRRRVALRRCVLNLPLLEALGPQAQVAQQEMGVHESELPPRQLPVTDGDPRGAPGFLGAVLAADALGGPSATPRRRRIGSSPSGRRRSPRCGSRRCSRVPDSGTRAPRDSAWSGGRVGLRAARRDERHPDDQRSRSARAIGSAEAVRIRALLG